MGEFEIQAVDVEQIRPLRQALLRPHQSADELIYPGDDAPSALHLGAFRNGRLVGIASVFPRPLPGRPGPDVWQLRGMAVEYGHRGYGLGGLLLDRCLAHARAEGARVVWCNARAGSLGFYKRFGFQREGDPFELPDIGPHYRMFLKLNGG